MTDVLLIGGGGREHALAWKLARSPRLGRLVAAPGNPGIARRAHCEPVDPLDPEAVTGLARRHGVDLVVIGPEAPLVAGVADAVRAAGIACYGPSAQAARLEGSKAFAKEVMAAAEVPTGMGRLCTTLEEVRDALAAFGAPFVVKDDGLAAGKGVVVTDDLTEALAEPYVPPKGTIGLPDGMVPPTPEQLTSGRWVPASGSANEPGSPDQSYAEFVSSGSWSGSDGCNGQGGSWSLDSQTGEWLASAGPQTLIGCDNVDVAGILTSARTVAIEEGQLVFYDAKGQQNGRLAPAE